MKIHSRFFIIFFFFALFFALTAYLAQDSIFKNSKAREQLKIENEVISIKDKIKNEPDSLKNFITTNGLFLTSISYDDGINIIDYQDKPSKLSEYLLDDYQTKDDILKACQQINNTDKQVIREKSRSFEGDFIVQRFCVDSNLYILTSPFVQYDAAINLLQQSYLPIFLATILVSAILSYILASYISRPITKMSFVTKKLSNLDFSNKVEIVGNDEIGELATNINILSDKFQHSIEKLKEAVIIEKESRERQVQLFASMSHELKTPITILKGTLEGIKDQVGPYKNPLDFVDDMIEETNNMENIVLHLLSYAKFSVNDVKLKFQPFHLEDLIDDAVERLDYLIKEKDIDLETHIVDDLVEVDLSSISMVFKNILENAIFYSSKNAKVEIFTSSFTDYMLIQIYNHGTNIDKDSILHIFEPFYRADDSRIKYKNGTGLGLTIVKQILEQHNSNFSLYNINNDEEYAVCFEFTLRKHKKSEK